MLIRYAISLIIILYSLGFAQGGYYVDPLIRTLPDTFVTHSPKFLTIPILKEDVRAVGMGKTQIANGRYFNAMLYNPAFLSIKRNTFEYFGIQAAIPPNSLKAANYLMDHKDEFEEALSFKLMLEGVREFASSNDLTVKSIAIQKIQRGLKFPHDLFREVIGSSDNPQRHGIKILPSVMAQFGNWGFALYGLGQSGFISTQSPILESLSKIELPADLSNIQRSSQSVAAIHALLQSAFDENFNIRDEALPITYSTSVMDLVGVAGYGYTINKMVHTGANLKVIHRRFSAKRFANRDYENVLNIIENDFNYSATGVTLDLGGLIVFPFGSSLAVSLLNIIPVKTLTSTMNSNYNISAYAYSRDDGGRVLLTEQGDTILHSTSRIFSSTNPIELKVPFLLNFGINHLINKNWDFSLEIFDAAKQDKRYESDVHRVRVGTEYRWQTLKQLGLSVRLGLAEKRITYGLGFNIYESVHIDGAYAYDNFVGTNAFFAQIRIGSFQ